MIDEIFRELSEVRESPRNRAELIEYNKKTAQALTAIYEIGLGAIGENDVAPDNISPKGSAKHRIWARNALRASQRKAWAKACGVAEK